MGVPGWKNLGALGPKCFWERPVPLEYTLSIWPDVEEAVGAARKCIRFVPFVPRVPPIPAG